MSFDTFSGLALNASIQGATWDSGDLTWGASTYLVGDGANNVKLGTGITSGFFVMSNFLHSSTTNGVRVFFKIGAGRDATLPAIGVSFMGDGSPSDYGAGNAILAQAGEYGSITIRQQGSAQLTTSGITFDPTQEYCLEVKATDTTFQNFVANLYLSSSQVIGSLVASTPTLSITTARPNTSLLSQTQRGGNASAPNLTISRVETLLPAAADTTAPNLSSPTASANGATGYTGSVSTDEAGGTLYYLIQPAATAAPSAATMVASGSTRSVSSTGTQAVSGSGLTAATAYKLHFMQKDTAGNASTVASSASFTTPAADTTAPTFPGGAVITPGTITSTSIAGSYPAASDTAPGVVAGYEVSKDNGATWTDNGTGLSFSFSGLAANTAYPTKVRAYDNANPKNYSAPLALTMTTSAATTGTFTTDQWTSSGTLRANQAFTGTWYSGGAPGTAGGTATLVSGTLSATATATITAPMGAGFLIGATADGGRFYQEGTVA